MVAETKGVFCRWDPKTARNETVDSQFRCFFSISATYGSYLAHSANFTNATVTDLGYMSDML